MKFELTDEQIAKIKEWEAAQDQLVVERQRAELDPLEDSFTAALARDGIPYYGAIGGSMTYCFTPTSMDVILIVKHEGTKATLDLTDYESW